MTTPQVLIIATLLLVFVGPSPTVVHGQLIFDWVTSLYDSTFDKVVTPDVNVLLKFDLKSPQASTAAPFRKFTETFHALPMMRRCALIAEVRMFSTEWFDDEADMNHGLFRRFNITVSNSEARTLTFRPVYMFLRQNPGGKNAKHLSRPARFPDTELPSEPNLLRFMQRQAADSFFALPGTLECLDPLVSAALRLLHAHRSPKLGGPPFDVWKAAFAEQVGALRTGTPKGLGKGPSTDVRSMALVLSTGLDAGELVLNATTDGRLCSDEAFERETQQQQQQQPGAREDLDYYTWVAWRLQHSSDVNAVLDEKRRLLAHDKRLVLKRTAKPPSPAEAAVVERERIAALRIKMGAASDNTSDGFPTLFFDPARSSDDRLERRLNILSVFRAVTATSFVNEAERQEAQREAAGKLAERRQQLQLRRR